MEQLWEKKWRSFRRTEPQSEPEYRRSIHNKPILRREGESLLRELTENEYDRVSHIVSNVDPGYLSFDNIFQGKKRVVVPFVAGPTGELNDLITFFGGNGYDVDWQDGLVNKEVETQRGKQLRKSKIGKTLGKAISLKKKLEEADLAWRSGRWDKENLANDKRNARVDKLREENPEMDIFAARRVADIQLQGDPEIKAIADRQEKLAKIRDQHSERVFKEFPVNLPSLHVLEGMLKFWNERGDFYRKNPGAVQGEEGKYSLVITRAPIDVLRMSDFDDITSCHSPPNRGSPSGGGYYQCAVAEANGHGPIAYVVENADVPEDFDWEADEVFRDEHRDVGGPTPLSRVRVRKFVHNEEEYELAVPEKRTYGKKFPNLIGAVVDFFRKSQAPVMENDPQDVDEFTRYGGSYADNTDGSLFNQLFDVDHFRGDTDHDADDEGAEEDFEEENREEQYEAECSDYDNQYNDYEHAYAGYEIEGEGDNTYVLMHGGITIQIDDTEMVDVLPDWRGQSELSRKIQSELSVSINDEVQFDEYSGKLNVRLDAVTHDVEPNPDGYREFLRYNVKELDDNYMEIFRTIRMVLAQEGILEKSGYASLRLDAEELEDIGDMFNHFDVEVSNDGEITVDSKVESQIPVDATFFVEKEGIGMEDLDQYDNGRVLKRGEALKNFTRSVKADGFRHGFWKGIVSMIEGAAKQMDLPGLDDDVEEEVSIRMPFDTFQIVPIAYLEKKGDQLWTGKISLDMILEGIEESEDVVIALRLIKYIDEHYDRVVKFAQQEFQRFVKSVNDTLDVVSGIMEKERMVEEILKEIEPYQKEMRRKHPKWKKMTIGMGGNKSTGGGPFTEKPSMERSKSAPPAGE